jgi:hypothetical protein
VTDPEQGSGVTQPGEGADAARGELPAATGSTGPHGAQGDPAVPQDHPSSGDPRVDDAWSRLAEVEALPLAEQVEVYTDIHRRLAAVLADPESRG